MTNQKPPADGFNYGTYLWQYVTDKTGTVFQTRAGNLGPNTPWGIRLWRCVPNAKPELIYFIEDGNGRIMTDDVNKRLLFLGTNKNGSMFFFVVPGYIHPDDNPSSTTVNVDEVQVASLKQGIATAQNMATGASATATRANNRVDDLQQQINTLTNTVNTLQQKMNTMQAQILSKSQIEDIVWSKIWDVNYLIRLGFIQGTSAIREVQDYLNDLASFIKRIAGK